MPSQKPHYQHLRDKLALKHLEKDLVMKELVKKHSAPSLGRNNNNDIFLDLIETIINQQLSSKAADAMLQKFILNANFVALNKLFAGFQLRCYLKLHIGYISMISADIFGAGAKQEFSTCGTPFGCFN